MQEIPQENALNSNLEILGSSTNTLSDTSLLLLLILDGWSFKLQAQGVTRKFASLPLRVEKFKIKKLGMC